MEKQHELFFEAGADGGGEALYRRMDGSFFTSGSSGGMLDEDEDPIRSWTHEYPDFDAYWNQFKKQHRQFWIRLYPVFIHPDIREFIRKEVQEYKPEDPDYPTNPELVQFWLWALEEKVRF